MLFKNVYQDDGYASAYAELEFPGTYYLAFRDIPALISKYVEGKKALDVGCGTGRSTRFLKSLGFDATGVDIADEMVARAFAADPEGDYRLVGDGDLGEFSDGEFDLILAAFTFDNIPTEKGKIQLLSEIARVLKRDGRAINLVSAPDIYFYEWASFSTRDYPQNREVKPGDTVRIVVTAIKDARPAVDILWSDEYYRADYARAGLCVMEKHNPLGRPDEPYDWINETDISPWSIYVLSRF